MYKIDFKFFSFFVVFFVFMNTIFVFADTNGVWHNPSDVRPGVFGTDEGLGDFIFNDELIINSPTNQGMFHISGASDSGNTYSAIYLNDNTVDNYNNWVFAHKKELGNFMEGDLHIGRWDSTSTLRVDLVVDKVSGNVGLGGAFEPEASLQILARPVPSFQSHFGGIRVVADSAASVDVAPGISFELTTGSGPNVGVVGVASGLGSFTDDSQPKDIVVRPAPGGSVRLAAFVSTSPVAIDTILEAKPNGDVVAKRYCFESGGCMVG